MPRIRSIKPEFWVSRTTARLSYGARLTFIGLWNFCDDEGRHADEPRLVKAAVWPLDDETTPLVVEKYLQELFDAGLIFRYSIDGSSFLAVRSWKEHQKIDRRRPSNLPAPPVDAVVSSSSRRALVEPSSREGKGKEGKGKEPMSSPDDGFERFWNLYPPRNGKKLDKARAGTAWRRLNEAKRSAAMVGVLNYAASEQLPKDAFRWLRDECWIDWQEPEVPSKQDPSEEWGELVRQAQREPAGLSRRAGGEA